MGGLFSGEARVSGGARQECLAHWGEAARQECLAHRTGDSPTGQGVRPPEGSEARVPRPPDHTGGRDSPASLHLPLILSALHPGGRDTPVSPPRPLSPPLVGETLLSRHLTPVGETLLSR